LLSIKFWKGHFKYLLNTLKKILKFPSFVSLLESSSLSSIWCLSNSDDLKSGGNGFLSLMVYQIAFVGAFFLQFSFFTTREHTVGYQKSVVGPFFWTLNRNNSPSSDHRETKHSSLDSSQRDASNGGNFMSLKPIDTELFTKI